MGVIVDIMVRFTNKMYLFLWFFLTDSKRKIVAAVVVSVHFVIISGIVKEGINDL
jgi:hypothetical protein